MSVIDDKSSFKQIKFDTSSTSVCSEGHLGWNADDGTLQLGMPGGNVCQQIGQEILIRVTNESGSSISNGVPVFISGATGNNIEIDLADAESQDDNRKTLAVATEAIADTQKGFVTTFGFVRDIDTHLFSEGQELFVKAGGGLTNVKPTLPDGIVRVGYCTRSHETEGVIFVNIATKSVKDILTDSGDLTIKTEAEKTLVLDKIVWDDLRFPLAGARLDTASGRLDYNYFNGGVDFASNARYPEEPISMVAQMSHMYKTDSELRPHIHWYQNQDETPNWLLAYKILTNGDTHAFDTDYSNHTFIVSTGDVFTYVSGTLLQISNFTPFTPSGFGTSGIIHFALFRDTANVSTLFSGVDSYTGTATNLEFDIHFQKDTLGSRQEFIK